MRIVINNMAIIIVFRFRNVWLFNLTLSHAVYDGIGTLTRSIHIGIPVLLGLVLALMGCQTPTEPKPHYHYDRFADTLWHDDMAVWNNGDTLQTLYANSLPWTSATVYAYQDTAKVFNASLTFSKPVAHSSKPVYWDGETIVILWDRMPKVWDRVIIKFTNKMEGK